ncbi:antibiotic biosynthesis monooxygenase family protein [Pseudonocardia alaniniphila]|uniref:Antibiotic biosynthesis monooxygenase n=1 Tax=Pseudonocardia alaniniphila TaxID=75291 RepID=A0ABS9T8U1_9PSEU|nr:antibiotic biosynthesis monooxygenase family protein [Pseudonocardia alaniniphila]MCH6164944.1 antibiotic biosynthesis monooxygenase [Pseudonocardia alaniniphila]
MLVDGGWSAGPAEPRFPEADDGGNMITEIVTMDVRLGAEEAFSSAFGEVCGLLLVSVGCRSVKLVRGVEDPSRFVAIVEWDSVESSVKNFVDTVRYMAFAARLMPYFVQDPLVEHFDDQLA